VTSGINLLARILSERFRVIIREELGLAYSSYAYNHPSYVYDNYGILHAIVKGNPAEIDVVLKKMEEIAALLAEKGVTEKELELVRKPLLNYIKDIQKTNTYWLDSVLSGSLAHPQQYEWAKNIFDEYSSISHATISLLAGSFLDIEESAVIIIRPAQLY